MRLNSAAKCHNLRGYPACECIEIATVGLWDFVINKKMEVFILNFSTLLQIIANNKQITTSKNTTKKITTSKYTYD